jgi:hypothetical protein
VLLVYNRFAADDYYTVFNATTRGILGSAWYVYQTWTPRPAAVLFSSLITGHFSEQTALIIYGLIVLLSLTSAFFKLMRLACKKVGLKISNLVLIHFSILLCCSFFFTSVSISETWFWLCSSVAYLLSIAAALWGLIFLLNKKSNALTFFLLLICFGYVMGAAESFAVFVFIVCIACTMYLIIDYRNNLSALIRLQLFKKLLPLTVFSFITLTFVYFGKGTQLRMTLLKQASVTECFYLPARTMAYLFFIKMPSKLPVLILFSLPFLYVGGQLKYHLNAKNIFSTRSLKVACVSFLALNYISLLPACYMMADRGPERSFTINALLLVVFFMYLTSYWGFKKGRGLIAVSLISIMAGLGYLTHIFVKLSDVAPYYANAVDKRIELVKRENRKHNVKTINLEPLPPCGLYYTAELSPDTNYYTNVFFKQRFGLKFNYRVSNGIYH